MATVAEDTSAITASFQAVSDLEMLGIVNDLGGGADDVSTAVIAKRFFGSAALSTQKQKCHTAIGSRMAWMKKIGLVEKGGVHGTWRLSSLGVSLLGGRLPRWRSDAIKNTNDSESLHLADNVGKAMLHSGDQFAAMERQLRHFVLRRKKG